MVVGNYNELGPYPEMHHSPGWVFISELFKLLKCSHLVRIVLKVYQMRTESFNMNVSFQSFQFLDVIFLKYNTISC